MPLRLRSLCALIWAALLALVLAVPAGGQSTIAIPGTAEISELIRRGQQLELEGRWGEALAQYEDGLRQFPGDTTFKRKFEFARLHYDLGRRYQDRSYRQLLTQLNLDEAMKVYDEVLAKMQTHYVDMPHWRELVDAGTADFEVALGNPSFLSANAPGLENRPTEGFRQEIRRLLAARTIQDRFQAREAVSLIATMAQNQLGIPAQSVVMEYVCGAAVSLDPYSTYLTPDQLNEVYSQIEGNFVGLGVELKAQNSRLQIVRVISNSPAKKAGLRDGDTIVMVDGQSTENVSTDKAANLLQGPPGSVAQLTVVGLDGQSRSVSVKRERIEVPSVDEVQILPGTSGVGYLKLTCFQKTTYRDLDAALWQLYRAGMKSLIVDLRGNPGGLLVSGVETADLFIEKGTIVSTHGRSRQEDFTYSAHEAGTWGVPLVVLIDQDSASAAEIFAGAIRDHHRGTIVGVRSYGKGSVQGIFPLASHSAGLRLTTAKFFSPTGKPYSGVGVEPQMLVRQVAKPIQGSLPVDPANDPYIAAGLQAAQQLTAQR